jgi:dihydropteroate synthase
MNMNFFIPSIQIQGKTLDFHSPRIMGVINLTENSFFEGSRVNNDSALLKKVENMIEDGADFIDLGATSTKPGSKLSTSKDELLKIIPAVEKIKANFPDAYISIDTYHADVAKEAVAHGAHIINDISGGSFDPKMFETIGKLKVPYVLMHIQGKPENMQQNPQYEDVVKEVIFTLSKKVNQLYLAGANDIIIDPGFGFGKTLEQNYQLLNALEQFQLFNLPVLVGLSRKSMVNKVLQTDADQALNGTTVLHTLALQKKAHILRVHDVKEAKQVINILNFAENNS